VIDHLVYGARDLYKAVAGLSERLGVHALPGGRHPGIGTHNALISLGPGTYLEVIAPDSSQPPPARLPFGLDVLTEDRLITWAARAADIERRADGARAADYDPGPVLAMSRETPDGVQLRWRLTWRAEPAGNGLVPFLIDWGDTPHPSLTAPGGCTLLNLRGEHPRPEAILPLLRALEVDLPVRAGPIRALIATIQTPRGAVELR
jgi:hypothetical protein